MQFLIASTFQDSLAKLQPGEQNAAKLAAIELQMNPAHPGLQMHKLDRARDKSFWSARISRLACCLCAQCIWQRGSSSGLLQ
jgi:hypothetical protein